MATSIFNILRVLLGQIIPPLIILEMYPFGFVKVSSEVGFLTLFKSYSTSQFYKKYFGLLLRVK